MNRGSLKLEYEGDLALLFIDNPTARNAISEKMMLELSGIIQDLETKQCPAVLISGRDGKAFCAGGDLKDVRKSLISPEKGRQMAIHMTACLNKLQSLSMIVIGAVEGAALGGGAELLTVCDYIVASEKAVIGFVHAALGVSPGWGGGARLIERVGRVKALQLLAFAKKLTAQQALEVGLVDEVVCPGKAFQVALAHCKRLCSFPKESVLGAINLVRKPSLELDIFSSLWGAEAHCKALSR